MKKTIAGASIATTTSRARASAATHPTVKAAAPKAVVKTPKNALVKTTAVKKAAQKTAPRIAAPGKSAPDGTSRKSPAPKSANARLSAATNGALKTPAAAADTAELAKPGLTEEHIVTMREKPRKPRVVRDSFTMPEGEYAVLGEVKKACLKAGYEVKKSELLRVGVALISKMDIVALKDILAALPPLKAGRPKKQ